MSQVIVKKLLERIEQLEPLHFSGMGPDLYVRRKDILEIIKEVSLETIEEELGLRSPESERSAVTI